ncbi:MAG: hypothetical protein QOG48_797, partial [Verrucomicrobiota bacterium]|jgi:signal transduction histidine kinase
LGWNLPIEQWLVSDVPGDLETSHSGRIASPSALGFLLAGSALFAASLSVSKQLRFPVVVGLSAALVVIGAIPLAAFLLELSLGPQWNFMGMAISGVAGAVGFTLLGGGLLALLQSEGRLKWSLNRTTTAGFALGVLLMVVAAAAAFSFTKRMLETTTWITHRQEVLKEIQKIMTNVSELAGAERLYVIVGDEQFLKGREQTKTEVEQDVSNVGKLTADNAAQQQRLNELKPLIAQRIDWEGQVIVARRNEGPTAAAAMIAQGRGVGLTEQIAHAFRAMQEEEYRLLTDDRKQAYIASTTAFSLLPSGVFLSLIILSLGIFYLNAGVGDQAQTEMALRESENEIRQLNVELEERVARRTAELEAANKELEAFSYSVSHDLRAPLRAVDGFSQAVLEDYGEQLPKEGRHYLQTIREGAQRMGLLIDDLLTFSRLSRMALKKETINMTRIVRDALAELDSETKGRKIDMQVHDLSPCHGDRALLKQVWINLLSNAVKYTRKSQHAVIEVGSQSENGENIYFVRDNGTGFDMQYAHKLFGVFQRLHGADEFEGTGVGLAIVQRIVHRHGGRVWAEAAPNRGATFHFSLKAENNI